MNDQQIYIKIIAFLGNRSEAMIAAAQSAMKSTYNIKEGDTHHEKSWLEVIAKSAFIQALFAGLLACIFISAWRIVSTIVHGESFYFLALAFATVIAETINEAVMVFRFALTDEKHKQSADRSKAEAFFHYASLMGVLRLISRLLFGRELPILQYLLVYLILVGVAFNLNYEMGLTGVADKGFHILYAMLPIVGIGILSHYLGVNLREEKAKQQRDNVDFEKTWQAEKLEWLISSLEAKAENGISYCAKALEYYYALKGLEHSAVSESSVGSTEQTAGFGALARQNGVNLGGTAEHSKRSEQFRTGDIEAAKRVLEAYPDKPLDDRGWHPIITNVTGVARGSGSTRVYEAMQYIKNNQEIE